MSSYLFLLHEKLIIYSYHILIFFFTGEIKIVTLTVTFTKKAPLHVFSKIRLI